MGSLLQIQHLYTYAHEYIFIYQCLQKVPSEGDLRREPRGWTLHHRLPTSRKLNQAKRSLTRCSNTLLLFLQTIPSFALQPLALYTHPYIHSINHTVIYLSHHDASTHILCFCLLTFSILNIKPV